MIFFSTSETGEKFTFKNLTKRLKNNEIVESKNFLFRGRHKEKQLTEAKKWAKKLKDKLNFN